MFQNGLLVLTSSAVQYCRSTAGIIQNCAKMVQNILYVHLIHDADLNLGREKNNIGQSRKLQSIPCTSQTRRFITNFYAASSNQLNPLNVRFLLSNISNQKMPLSSNLQTLSHNFDVVLTDIQLEHHMDLIECVGACFPNCKQRLEEVSVKQLAEISATCPKSTIDDETTISMYDSVCLGGTFDRLHVGHLILLSDAALICNKILTVGVTDGAMNKSEYQLF